MCKSVRHSPQAVTRKSTCLGPGSGGGTPRSTRGWPGRSSTIARIARLAAEDLPDDGPKARLAAQAGEHGIDAEPHEPWIPSLERLAEAGQGAGLCTECQLDGRELIPRDCRPGLEPLE